MLVSRLHVQVFIILILHMFSEGIFCVTADIISVFRFTSHFAKHIRCNWYYCSSYPFGKFSKVLANGGTYTGSFM